MSSVVSYLCLYIYLHAAVTALGQDQHAFVLGLPTADGNPDLSTSPASFLLKLNQSILFRQESDLGPSTRHQRAQNDQQVAFERVER